MPRHRFVVLCPLLLAALALVGGAHEPGAGDATHFLRPGLGPRARAMGGAFTAVTDDLSAIFWNPAGLMYTPGLRLGGGYESRFAGLATVQHGAGAFAAEELGAGALWISADIYSAYQLSVAGRLGDVAVGAGGRVYALGEGLQRGYGLGVDLGLMYTVALDGTKVALGLVTRDIGWTTIRWGVPGVVATDHAAWVLRLGGAVHFEGTLGTWTWALDIETTLRRPPVPGENDYLSRTLQYSLNLGAQLRIEGIALRVGIAHLITEEGTGAGAEPSFGVGVQMQGILLDAAYVLTAPGYTYLVSVEFQLGKEKLLSRSLDQ